MKSDQVEKKIILVDGEEYPGLINLDEYVIEDDVVDVPGRDKTVPVRTGVKKIPQIGATYKVNRDSPILKGFQDWYNKNEVHEITLIRTDGAGNEFARELWLNVECSKNSSGAYDASSPTTAQIMVNFLPEDIIEIGAES